MISSYHTGKTSQPLFLDKYPPGVYTFFNNKHLKKEDLYAGRTI
jgi:hypothetical protein